MRLQFRQINNQVGLDRRHRQIISPPVAPKLLRSGFLETDQLQPLPLGHRLHPGILPDPVDTHLGAPRRIAHNHLGPDTAHLAGYRGDYFRVRRDRPLRRLGRNQIGFKEDLHSGLNIFIQPAKHFQGLPYLTG